MIAFKCYKVYVTDVEGNENLIFVPVHLISEYLENALQDSRVLITSIKEIKLYNEKAEES